MDKNKPFIKMRKKVMRERLFKLPNLHWSIAVSIISLFLLIVSYFCRSCNWLSGTLVSASCSGLMGLVFYFLSNVRNNKLAKLEIEHRYLSDLNDTAEKIQAACSYYKYKNLNFGYKRDIDEDCCDVMVAIEELSEKISDLPYDLYVALGFRDNNSINDEKFTSLQEELEDLESKKDKIAWLKKTHKFVIDVRDVIHEPLYERKDQIEFMGKYIF